MGPEKWILRGAAAIMLPTMLVAGKGEVPIDSNAIDCSGGQKIERIKTEFKEGDSRRMGDHTISVKGGKILVDDILWASRRIRTLKVEGYDVALRARPLRETTEVNAFFRCGK